MNSIFWTGYCNKERIIAIIDIENIINDHGYLVDFKQFSDISISITIELEESKIDRLYNILKNYMSMNEFEYLNSTYDTERIVFFNITFIKGTGDLRIEIQDISE